MTGLLALALALALAGPARAGTCASWADTSTTATVAGADVTESSGLARSLRVPGAVWTHDDSGGEPVLTLISPDGATVGASRVEGVGAIDWEDAAGGPCPDRVDAPWCLYVGDIGDNAAARAFVTVLVLPEPSPGESATVARRWELTWPGGARDSEALLVNPRTGTVELVEKAADGESLVARVPPDAPHGRVELEAVATLQVPGAIAVERWVTGGAWDAAGRRVVLRTYANLLVYAVTAGEPWTAAVPTVLAGPDAAQGEAVALLVDGTLVTTSEGSPLQVTSRACASPRPDAPDATPAAEAPTTGGGGGTGGALGPLSPVGLPWRRWRRRAPPR